MYNKNEKKLMAPVLDRLLQQEGTSQANHLQLRQLRESVRRDLENLMNTRFRCVSPDDELKHVGKALPNYGLPDLSTVNLSSAEALNTFCHQIADTIRHYEPRIKSVKVESQKSVDPEDPTIRFRMEAILHANPAQELLIFDSALDPVTQSINILEMR